MDCVPQVLREIQEEHDGLEEEYEKEARALEEKYRNLMTPLYERRQARSAGVAGPAGCMSLRKLQEMPTVERVLRQVAWHQCNVLWNTLIIIRSVLRTKSV